MKVDSVSLRALARELRARLPGSRARKISQLGPHDYVLWLRRPGATETLLVCLQPGQARVHLTRTDLPEAQVPSAFTMLLRKHLEGARLTEVDQPGLERALHLRFASPAGERLLIVEIPGRSNNLVLADEAGRILGLHQVVRARGLVAGALYRPAGRPDLPQALEVSGPHLVAALSGTPQGLARALAGAVFGLPPLQAEHLLRQAGLDADRPASAQDLRPLARVWEDFRRRLDEGPFSPVLLPGGRLSPWPLGQPGEVACPDMQAAAEAAAAQIPGLDQRRAELARLLARARERVQRRLECLQAELERSAAADELRRQAELLLSRQAEVPPGATRVALQPWEGGPAVEVELDTDLTPAQNAERLFRLYKGRSRAREILAQRVEEAGRELEFLEEMELACAQAATSAELEEVARLWREQSTPSPGWRRAPARPAPGPRRFRYRGFDILVGRNPRQNETLALRTAAADDLWFHARQIPGAHVLLRTAGRAPAPEVVQAAAVLAARFSKAAQSSRVSVDYTAARRLRKPAGSLPGCLIYRGERTLVVDPRHFPPELEELTP